MKSTTMRWMTFAATILLVLATVKHIDARHEIAVDVASAPGVSVATAHAVASAATLDILARSAAAVVILLGIIAMTLLFKDED